MKTRTGFLQASSKRSGMTLIELTVVILVLLSLVSILFIGARAYKAGSDRAQCVMQIRQMQLAVRSYANLNKVEEGVTISSDLPSELVGPGRFLEMEPICPGGGNYTLDGNEIPLVGALYMSCSLSSSDRHIPESFDDW
jgi:prepilin-type N-terminal cleavage/methylation domain-containing protein